MEKLEVIGDEELQKLLPALAEAARANQQTVERFVPPKVGIVDETASRRHQFILGRRGVGKSSLVRMVERDSRNAGSAVAFIDLETLKGIPYPDVLIQLLIELFKVLEQGLKKPRFASNLRRTIQRYKARRDLRRLRNDFAVLLSEPESSEVTVRRIRSRAAKAGSKIELDGAYKAKGAGLGIHAGREREDAEAENSAYEATFTRTKMEGLYAAASSVRSVLSETMGHLAESPGYILLDDFYHIRHADQPSVLAYLHQVVKNLDIYLKVCAVRHRLNEFVEGDPPVGLQIGHDAGQISLDITLASFPAAQRFLESVLEGICDPLDIHRDQFITEAARQRLVLASGGVARDYLNLIHSALREANERSYGQFRLHNRIGNEDVNEASARLSEQKQDDLRRDAGPNAEALRERLTDVVRFCLDHNETNVFLVEGTKLTEEQWGREIQALTDLRLVHEIGNFTIKNSRYRGRRFVGFTLDLSNYTGTRSERIKQVNFWQKGGIQGLRRISLIYYPEYVRKVPIKFAQSSKQQSITEQFENVPLFDLGEEQLEFEETDPDSGPDTAKQESSTPSGG
jgi:hypothetical protein